VARPVREWRGLSKDPALAAKDLAAVKYLRLRGGVLAQGIAGREWPPRQDYEAPRRLEYTVVLEAWLSVVLVALALCLLVCLVIVRRWAPPGRRGGGAAPAACQVAGVLQILGLGILLPLGLFALVTECIPPAARPMPSAPLSTKWLPRSPW